MRPRRAWLTGSETASSAISTEGASAARGPGRPPLNKRDRPERPPLLWRPGDKKRTWILKDLHWYCEECTATRAAKGLTNKGDVSLACKPCGNGGTTSSAAGEVAPAAYKAQYAMPLASAEPTLDGTLLECYARAA